MVFTGFVDVLLGLIQQYGVLAVILAVVIEEVIAPIPSQPIVMGAAFLLVDASLSFSVAAPQLFLYIVLPAAAAGTLSSLVWFFIAYYGGKPAVMRFSDLLRITWEDVASMEERLEEHHWDAGFVALFRSIPVVPVIAVTVAGGTVRMNPWTYTGATFVGMLVRNSILAYIGWQSHALYKQHAAFFGQIETYVIITFAVLAVAGLWYWRRTRTAESAWK